jgi:hypothetical protein
MKKIVFILLIIPTLSYSQKIAQDEIDKFTKSHVIKTSEVTLKAGLNTGFGVYFRSDDSTIFVVFDGYGKGASVIGKDDKIILLFENDSTLTETSTGIQDYSTVETSLGQMKKYHHQYNFTKEDLQLVKSFKLKAIRIYEVDAYENIDIPTGKQDQMKKLAQVFYNQFYKN